MKGKSVKSEMAEEMAEHGSKAKVVRMAKAMLRFGKAGKKAKSVVRG